MGRVGEDAKGDEWRMGWWNAGVVGMQSNLLANRMRMNRESRNKIGTGARRGDGDC